MGNTILPTSPNWYCSKIVDSNVRGLLVFGARHEVFTFDAVESPLKFKGGFTGHRHKVTAVSLCQDSKFSELCCSGDEDGSVKLWNVDTLDIVDQHSLHDCKVTSICWSELRADVIITGDEGGSIGVWQFEDGKQRIHKPEKGPIQVMSASPKHASLIAIGYKTGQILLVDVKHGASVVSRLRGHDEEIHTLSWCSIPGEAFKPEKETTDITDLESFGVDDSWRKKPKPICSESGFGQDGWLLASGSKDRTIRIWSTSKERQLLLLKLPNPGRRGERGEDGGRSRLWLSLFWSKHSPTQIVSSSQSGELYQWDITKQGKERCQSFNSGGRGHSRMVFNICHVGPADSAIVCTISMDRMILFWDLKLKSPVMSLPSLGGFCYAIRASPFDPGHLALGVGDAMIRLWNLNATSDLTEMTCLWQGIRSKVTALCWHPKKEGLLAYGTDDGRVGIFDTLSNKPPKISTTYHKRTVYVVAWGPTSKTKEGDSSASYSLYSCGDGVILEHFPSHLDGPALSISKLIAEVNQAYKNQTKTPTQSEISWSPDFQHLAVGNDDGTVEIYEAVGFTLIATIQVLHKLINSIQWHPHVTMASLDSTKYKHCIAIGGTETSVCVVDLSKMYSQPEGSEPLHLVECLRRLDGHHHKVTELAWSPHTEGQLASVSFDGKALVWNIDDGRLLACYTGHMGKLLTVQWNGCDPNEVITGGDDYSLHRWRIDKHPPDLKQLENKKDKKKKKRAGQTRSMALTDTQKLAAGGDASEVTMATEDEKELVALLEAKKQELLLQESAGKDGKESEALDGASQITTTSIEPQMVSKGDNKTKSHKQMDSSHPSEKRRKPKSMFPVMNMRDNMRGKAYILEDIATLTRLVYDDKARPTDLPEDIAHLGLFLDRRAVYACLKLESDHHRNNDNMEYFYQLEIWKGNINAVLRVARQRDELSDWLVAMAPMASYDTWTSVCEDYALQLEADGQYHKAASYFLACHKVYEAIKLFKRHKLFKEAIALAKVRLSPLDPALEELYTLWAQQLTKDGNYEQAAKCHLAMRQVQDAAKLLARRYDQSSLRTAANISLIANEKQQGIMYTHRLMQQHLSRYEWREAYTSVEKQKELQVFLATGSFHEMLTQELTKMKLLDVDPELFTKWQKQTHKKTGLPDFILDPGDVDSLSPWQPRLVEGHTFPHHVLRTWYSKLEIAMDTTNLEDMYKTLCLLHAGRQSQVDLHQVLIQVSMDLTLCMLSLMMSETPTAMSHFLQAIGSLHETGHLQMMQALLQLFLPQGPKYILKLQQEVTAMRVMISMDTHSHVDGASKVHTLKRYLSDLKDESIVNTASMRCRELDCLRAYYYVGVLNFLKEKFEGGEAVDVTKPVADTAAGVKEINGESIAGTKSDSAVIVDRKTNIENESENDVNDDQKTLDRNSIARSDQVDSSVQNENVVIENVTKDNEGESKETNDMKSENVAVTKEIKTEDVELNISEGKDSNSIDSNQSQNILDLVASVDLSNPIENGDSTAKETDSVSDDVCKGKDGQPSLPLHTSSLTTGSESLTTSTSSFTTSSASLTTGSSTTSSSEATNNHDKLTQGVSEPNQESKVNNSNSETGDMNKTEHEVQEGSIVCSKDSNTPCGSEVTEEGPRDSKSMPSSTSQSSASKLDLVGASKTLSDSPDSSSPHSTTTSSPSVLNASHYTLTLSQLYQISQGLIWDIQAKRFALTETLGYIHKAISQLLLSKNPKPSDSNMSVQSSVQVDNVQQTQSETMSVPLTQENAQIMDRTDTDRNDLNESRANTTGNAASSSITSSVGSTVTSQGELEGAVGMATEEITTSVKGVVPASTAEHQHLCEHHAGEIQEGHLCHAALTHHFDHILTAHSPQSAHSSQPPNIHRETEFKCTFFDVCSSCELLQKSRKILFEDEPHFQTRPDGGLKDATIVTNPAKYINMPDEWYSMPVDLKYFKPYVTMATLKDEQEYVMRELKRGPDSTQAPFPNPMESVKPMLDISLCSPRISAVERKEFAQKLINWALTFAVTSQQKHTFMTLLQNHMET